MKRNKLEIITKKSPLIYFGHPINTYNTDLEKKLEQRIKKFLPEYEIENPNKGHHQYGYKKYKNLVGNGMLYFYNEVLPNCDAGIFLPFKDGMFGAGVWGEMQYLSTGRKPVWEINSDLEIMSVDTTNNERALSVEETRKYISHEY